MQRRSNAAGFLPRAARGLVTAGALLLSIAPAASAQSADPIALRATLDAIRTEGFSRSQAMDHISWLSDVYGPRVSGTPAIEQAGAWAADRLRSWGLANVHEERFAFGRGWSLVRFHAHMVEPQVMPDHRVPQVLVAGHRRRRDGRGRADRHQHPGRLRHLPRRPARQDRLAPTGARRAVARRRRRAADERRAARRGGPHPRADSEVPARPSQRSPVYDAAPAVLSGGRRGRGARSGQRHVHDDRRQRSPRPDAAHRRGHHLRRFGRVAKRGRRPRRSRGHPRRRALQPDGPHSGEGDPGADGAARRDPVPPGTRCRPGAERVQPDRRAAGRRPRG